MLPFRDVPAEGSPEIGGHVRGDWIDRLLHDAASMATNGLNPKEVFQSIRQTV